MPLEILDDIAELTILGNKGHASGRNPALVSRKLHAVSVRALYRRLEISDLPRLFSILKTFIRNPSLAHLVRELLLNVRWHYKKRDLAKLWKACFFTRSELDIPRRLARDEVARALDSLPAALPAYLSTFPRLEYLSVDCHGLFGACKAWSRNYGESYITSLLPPTLKTLELHDEEDDYTFQDVRLNNHRALQERVLAASLRAAAPLSHPIRRTAGKTWPKEISDYRKHSMRSWDYRLYVEDPDLGPRARNPLLNSFQTSTRLRLGWSPFHASMANYKADFAKAGLKLIIQWQDFRNEGCEECLGG
ncbi:hypothetical protein B0H63DRAFT_452450 [Podospora didyma]|uniref:Uncharacterized protein n=1 Tax=Podospora didyma TaxID=330526 RepID=A0AAE0N931_9PEZI|nr:hypothetical protein B0H63DRAFT_452450 [Podospora didyma]